VYNGIDRIDNTKGYTSGNCLACCIRCNKLKGKLSLAELEVHIKKMVRMIRGAREEYKYLRLGHTDQENEGSD
jgi:hypothetical protein